MGWLGFVLLAVAAIAWWAVRKGEGAEADASPLLERHDQSGPDPAPDAAQDSANAAYEAELMARSKELEQAAAKHCVAIVLLMGIARADGRTSPAETQEIAQFLHRQGVRRGQLGVIDRVRREYTGTTEESRAAIQQMPAGQAYRADVLRTMELIVERGKLAHPEELELVRLAAESWGLPVPKFYMPVGKPISPS